MSAVIRIRTAGVSLQSHLHRPLSLRPELSQVSSLSLSTNSAVDDTYDHESVSSFKGHNFPDFIEKWNRAVFRKCGYGLAGLSATAAVIPATLGVPFPEEYFLYTPALALSAMTAVYWRVGLNDIKQPYHAIRRNYPVLGNFRYIFETIRPEVRQYVVESDYEGRPIDRIHRSQVYQRAKNVDDTMAFGTQRLVYEVRHEWACHSMYPAKVRSEATRVMVGTTEYGTTKPYSASIFNISGMSYGALGDNAIIALNKGARLGGFYHNTGEGGISKKHREGGGDLVWNIGTGYFGCGTTKDGQRVFDPVMFRETVDDCEGRVKMIEIKLSQGAKPAHGGLLPKGKITREIADARKIEFPPSHDCHSPARHSAFDSPEELVAFIAQLRELSGGLPVGLKMCVGNPGEFALLCRTISRLGSGPDFINIDGAEGGTGAAPREFLDSIGLPLEEGLVLARNILVGADLRKHTKIVAAGKVSSGFAITRNMALGADICNAARAFMLSLGCIMSLKCNTNRCPTGICTQDRELMEGLDPKDKMMRVYNFHRKTVDAACQIVGAMGYDDFSQLTGDDIMRRVRSGEVRTLSEHFPEVPVGCLLDGTAPKRLQEVWDNASRSKETDRHTFKRWIY